jgi:hypothetical protein
MIGSPLAPVVTAIVSVIALAVWLAMVFYADAHPPQADSHVVAERDNGREITATTGGSRMTVPKPRQLTHRGGRRWLGERIDPFLTLSPLSAS